MFIGMFKGIEIKYKYLIVSFSGLKRSNLIYYFVCKIQSHDCHSACCVCACVCVSVAKKQCCLSSVKESRCELGMISARGGDTCEMKEEKQCTDDSYQVLYCLTTTRTPKAMLLSKTSGICFDVLYKMMHAVERDKKQEEDGWVMTERHDVIDGWRTHFLATEFPIKQTLNWLNDITTSFRIEHEPFPLDMYHSLIWIF